MSKPLPEVTDKTLPFWQAGLEGVLRMQRCGACSHIRFPLGPVCTQCLSETTEWVPVSRRGAVLAHLVFHRGYGSGWNDQVPYSVLYVQLPEGPRMFLDLIDAERFYIEQDLVGRTAEIVFEIMSPDIAVPRASIDGAMP